MALAVRIARAACVSEPRFILATLLPPVRHCSSNSEPPPKKKHLSKYTQESMRKNVKGYMFKRLFDYVKNYDKVLEKNFPTAVNVYRIFFDGVKNFFEDMQRYLKIARIVNNSTKGPRALNRKELELYMQMPKDMFKVAPAIILSSLPMIGYAAFPVAYMFPKTFLTSHFWTLQQKVEFQQIMLTERLHYNRPVLRVLQSKLDHLENPEHQGELSYVLGRLGSGFHPTVDDILNLKGVFTQRPYSLPSLSSSHIKNLLRMHGLPVTFFRRHRITEHAYILHYMDLAIVREGGVHNMPQESLRYACLLRGLNPSNLSNEEMIKWLRAWVEVSQGMELQHISLFLHLPIFLAYNHPNNWQLIYNKD